MNNYASIGNQVRGWYSRTLLEHAQPVLILEAFALMKSLPRNNTKVIEFRRSKQLPRAPELVEGVAPSPDTFSYDAVQITMKQYGAVSLITDHIEDFSKDSVMADLVERQGEQVGELREALLWDVLRAGTALLRAGGHANRADLTKADVYSTAIQRRAVAILQRNKANPIKKVVRPSVNYETYAIPPTYIGICHTDAVPTLSELAGTSSASTNHFVPASQYGGDRKQVSVHEVGSFERVAYVASPDLPAYGAATTATASASDQQEFYTSGSANNFDVYSTLILGRSAYGVVRLKGKSAIRPVIVRPGTVDSGNKLGQVGWAGWSMYFAAKILNESWMLRIESVMKQA